MQPVQHGGDEGITRADSAETTQRTVSTAIWSFGSSLRRTTRRGAQQETAASPAAAARPRTHLSVCCPSSHLQQHRNRFFPTNHQRRDGEMDGHLLDDRYPVPGRSCSMMNVLATWERERPGTLFSPRAQQQRAAQVGFPTTCQPAAAGSKRARTGHYLRLLG
jgi:hypothetical protein